MASLEFENEQKEFRAFYLDNHDRLKNATNMFENLITSLITSETSIEKPTFSSRVKDMEESIKKFSRKYQTKLEKSNTPYSIRDHITDIIGVRVVCYYEADIGVVVKKLKENFETINETDKIAEIEEKEGTFGYKGHHLDLKLNSDRNKLSEYALYNEFRFEVQVRTIIQNAWSVLDHKIKYKQSIPSKLKRQINSLAALFEIADREFYQIKNTTIELEAAKPDSSSVLASMEPQFNVFTFLSVVKKELPEYQLRGGTSENFTADSFTQEIVSLKGTISSAEFSEALSKCKSIIKNYVDYQSTEHRNDLNPFTQIRHMLYFYDKPTFKLVLYEYQRKNFDKWLAEKLPGQNPAPY